MNSAVNVVVGEMKLNKKIHFMHASSGNIT